MSIISFISTIEMAIDIGGRYIAGFNCLNHFGFVKTKMA